MRCADRNIGARSTTSIPGSRTSTTPKSSTVAHRIRYAPSGGPFDATFAVSRESLHSHEEFYLFDQLIKQRAYRGLIQGTNYPLLDRDVSTASLSWNYAFEGFKLSNVTAFQDVDLGRSFPFGTFFGPIQVITPEGKKTWSHESRLTYDGGGPLTGLLGVYFQDDRFTRDATTSPAFAPASNNKVDTRAAALFGEFTYALTQQLFLTAGTRFAYDEAAIDFNQPGVLAFSNSVSFRSVQPKVSLGYQVNDATRVYVLASRGYKPGGFNHTVSSIADATPYDPERALNLEAGVRTSLFNDRLWLSTALYDIQSHDKQIYTGPIGFQVIRNIGDATSRGVELEARLRPAERLMLTATAELRPLDLRPGRRSRDGRHLQREPRPLCSGPHGSPDCALCDRAECPAGRGGGERGRAFLFHRVLQRGQYAAPAVLFHL